MLLRETKKCNLKSKNLNSFLYLAYFYMLARKQQLTVVLYHCYGPIPMTCNLLFFKLSISSAFEKWKAFLCFVYTNTGFKFVGFLPFHLIESSQNIPEFLPRLWYTYFFILKKHLKSWNHEPFNPLNNSKLF